MRFRPCIDLHQGKVKQIVGSTYRDSSEQGVRTNFVTNVSAAEFAAMYRRDGLRGGHVIMIGPGNEQAAIEALSVYPGGLQIGGGISPQNAVRYLDAGASHVIVTSYVFREGQIVWDRLEAMRQCVGTSRLVLDLSCRRQGRHYKVVTDRWQRVSETVLEPQLFERLSDYCDEFLVHAVDVEGLCQGVDESLVFFLAKAVPKTVTYAGGVRSLADLERIRDMGQGRVDVTVGSALDIFGGPLPYRAVVEWFRMQAAT